MSGQTCIHKVVEGRGVRSEVQETVGVRMGRRDVGERHWDQNDTDEHRLREYTSAKNPDADRDRMGPVLTDVLQIQRQVDGRPIVKGRRLRRNPLAPPSLGHIQQQADPDKRMKDRIVLYKDVRVCTIRSEGNPYLCGPHARSQSGMEHLGVSDRGLGKECGRDPKARHVHHGHFLIQWNEGMKRTSE